MAEPSAVAPELPTKSLAEFLESVPPNVRVAIPDFFDPAQPADIKQPDIQLHCTSDLCNGTRSFRYKASERAYVDEGWNFRFLTYICRNCDSVQKTYSVAAYFPKERTAAGIGLKLGEVPGFGPHVPSRVITLIGPDREIFLRGRRAESLGLGIGAFAYYRRVVENQKGRIIGEIGKVAKRLGATPATLHLFERAEAETPFTAAIEIIKAAIPEGLRIKGHNPLTLLHRPLSEGLHELNDEQCLELATSIRVVLTELADRISQIMQDQKELDDAVSRLLNRGVSGEGSAEPIVPKSGTPTPKA